VSGIEAEKIPTGVEKSKPGNMDKGIIMSQYATVIE
jgi:hypothetical protein